MRGTITQRTKNRIWILFTSFLFGAILMITYQAVIYAASLDTKDRLNDRIQYEMNTQWGVIKASIEDATKRAESNLNYIITPGILTDINKHYGGDLELLEYDLMNLSDVAYDNPIISIISENIDSAISKGDYFTRENIFAMTKTDGIIVDPSILRSSKDRPRSLDKEAISHHNPKLASQAFHAIVEQSQRLPIFWQFYQPDDLKFETAEAMHISELERIYKESNGNLDVLGSYEFLVPIYIFFDQDLLGNKLVNQRGIRQDIYQIILVQNFNIKDIINDDSLVSQIYYSLSEETPFELSEFLYLSRLQQILLFLGLVIIIALIQFSFRIKTRMQDPL